jgi:hypothetical protein
MIGRPDQTSAPPEAVCAVRSIIAKLCGYDLNGTKAKSEDLFCTTNIDANFFEAWRSCAKDPDTAVCQWFIHGAPSGLKHDPEGCGISPATNDSPELNVDDLETDFDNFRNYAGVDDDDTAEQEVASHEKSKHVREFSSFQELVDFLYGELPILSRIGLIIKEKGGVIKKRMILDTKWSFLKFCSAKHQRVLLPRLLDAILQGLNLLSETQADAECEWFVLDFKDAFWQVPLRPDERRFFCANILRNGEERYVVFLRAVQGSRSAPLSWARVVALLQRLTQSAAGSDKARLHCFIYDPIASISGTQIERDTTITLMVLIWEALGFQLSYKKGQRGKAVDWIGGHLQFTPHGIKAQVKQAIIDDIVSALDSYAKLNVIAKKELRSFVGRSNHAAGLLLTLRPFLQSIWSALASPDGSGPVNTVWKKQIEHSLSWMSAFFASELPGLERHFTLAEYRCEGPRVEIGTDASPWGLGGWLAVDGAVKKYFSCQVSADDLEIFSIERGSCTGQQVLEGLAILVALRLWYDKDGIGRINICVRGDNVGALTLLVKMRPASAQQAIVARELALLTVKAAFPPRVIHTPGVAHKLADLLLRVYDPRKRIDISCHPILASAERTVCPERPRSFYSTLDKATPLRIVG